MYPISLSFPSHPRGQAFPSERVGAEHVGAVLVGGGLRPDDVQQLEDFRRAARAAGTLRECESFPD
jgi:hypothetical protein